MSGLLGYVNFDPAVLAHCRAATQCQLLRFSWVTWDWWTSADGTTGLGRADLGKFNPGPQPIAGMDGAVQVLLSGELYRTAALAGDPSVAEQAARLPPDRFDDAALVLAAYLAFGPACLARLEGVYHLAILDQRVRRLYLSNDRFGLRPLYWAHYRGHLAFGPEVKTLLHDPQFTPQLDDVALAEYMRFQHLLGDKTFFEGISLLPPATILTYDFDADGLTLSSYWDFTHLPELDPRTSYADIVAESAALFQDAVAMLARHPVGTATANVPRRSDDARVGLYLSGGLDSRLIAGCLAKTTRGFPTISYGHHDAIDVHISRKIARLLGTDHHYFPLDDGAWVSQYAGLHLDLTEGFHSWVHSHGMSTLATVHDLLAVNLTGLGVDNGLGNNFYWDPLFHEAQDDYAFECRLFHLYNQKYSWPGLNEAEAGSLYTSEYRHLAGLAFDSLRHEVRRLAASPPDRRAEYFLVLQHDRRLNLNYIVFNSSHFENRFPGYNYPLFDYVYSFSAKRRSNRRLEKDVIELIDPRLALLPQAKDGLLFTRRPVPRLAHHVVTRLKQRINRHTVPIFWQPCSLYVDYENWLRHELRPWAEGILFDGRLAARGIFDERAVRSLMARHVSGRELNTIGKLAPIMAYEMMLGLLYDNIGT
jgi:asparagine synthase (glutamine-hydrolysing)